MKRSYLWVQAIALLILSSFILFACNGGRFGPNNSNNTTIISGQVVDQASTQPIAGAVVKIISPPQFAKSTITDSTGIFRFEIQMSKRDSLSIEATKDSFDPQTRTISAGVGTDINNINLELLKTKAGGGGDGDSTKVGAAAISLTNDPPEAINIAETGTAISAPFTFQVVDSAGNALTTQNAVEVNFTLKGPGGKEHLIPEKATTNDEGAVTTTLYSGNKAGVVKVQAIINANQMGFQMKSSPVSIAINGGYAEKTHFSISSSRQNIEVKSDSLPTVSVSLGDQFSNPVKPGTAVSFKTSGGVIQGSANTDKNGNASVQFTSLYPQPADGHVTVTASTINANSNPIQKQVALIFSSSAAKVNATPENFKINQGGSQSFNYTVTDKNGNPMARGTKIKVEGDDGITVKGDTLVTLGDYLSAGTGKTNFNFTATDNGKSQKNDINIKITVTPPTGTPTIYNSILGQRIIEGSAQVGAAAIALVNTPKDAININETGGNVSAPLTFQVRDSLGRPLTAENKVNVQFSLVNSPGGSEDLVPHKAATDGEGKVTTTLFSGNKAGPVKLQALVERSDIGLTIKSKPVLIAIQGGFPDNDHFSIAPKKHNFEGFDINNQHNTITVVLGDKFSNPVKPGTIVYFSTSGGIIQGSAKTDEDGIASVDLISGNPRPADGKATVTATTVNDNDASISAITQIIFATSAAKITASPSNFDIPNGGSETFTYSVTDTNGNPMPAGTTINVDAGNGLNLSGDINFTLGDYLEPGPGRTNFNFSAVDADNTNAEDAKVTFKITVTSPLGNTTTYTGLQGERHGANGSGNPPSNVQ